MNSGVKRAIVLSILLILIAISIIVITNYKDIDTTNYNNKAITKFDNNQYMDIMVNDDSIVSIYLNDFIYNTKNDIEVSYDTLNEVYRVKKFGSIDKYKEYLNNNNFTNELTAYDKTTINGKIIYDVIDKYGNRYIIKEKSIMNYEIYLDDYTVEIK